MALRFDYKPEKFIQALAYFANSGLPWLSKLKVHKLLYFADKYHLLNYGRPVVGDQYFCLPFGPLPTEVDNFLDGAEDAATWGQPQDELFDCYLTVDCSAKYPEYRAKAQANLEVFSETEVEALKITVQQYGRLHPMDLVRLTHEQADYKLADLGRPEHGRSDMPYELFFEGQSPEVRRMLDVAVLEQEDRDFANALRAAGRRALAETRRSA